ncbi:MAG: hypothetical protein IKN59_01010 [Paludibacteraceae bacterium]|nr:hypothetical protein [Paludibacteraceae bacterium]
MKKLFTFFLALMAATTMFAAELNIYASGLSVSASNGATYVNYTLNAPANALNLLIYPAVGEPIVVPITDENAMTKGAHSIAINANLPAGSYSWALMVNAMPNTELVEVTEDDDAFRYYLPQDVAVDNNPESPFFGHIYVSESTKGLSDGMTNTTKHQTRGIYIYNADLTFTNGQTAANLGYDGGIGGVDTLRAGFKRIAIDEAGYVYIASRDASTKGVYRMDPANPTADFVTVLSANASVDALGIVGGMLYTLEGIGSGSTNKLNAYSLANIPVGDPVMSLGQDTILGFANPDADAVPDGRGGWWFVEHRYAADGYPALVHMTAQGVNDYEVSAASNADLLSNDRNGGITQRGVIAINEEGDLLALGSNKGAVVLSIEYNDSTGVPTLTALYDTGLLGTNIDGVAFDVANNLYVATAANERFHAFALPKDENMFITPAPSNQKITIGGTPILLSFQDDMTKYDGDPSSAISTVEKIFKFDAGYVASVSGCSKIYNARNGYGIKFGSSSAPGTLTINLAETLRPDSIIFHAAAYGDTEGTAIFMGDTIDLIAAGNKMIAPYTKVFDGNTDVTAIEIKNPTGNKKRFYLVDIEIYVNGATKPALADRVFEDGDYIYLNLQAEQMSHINYWLNDGAVPYAHFIGVNGDSTTVRGSKMEDIDMVRFAAPVGAFQYVAFTRNNPDSVAQAWNFTAPFDLRIHPECNMVLQWNRATATGNGYNTVVWGFYEEFVMPEITYSIKHPWGGGEWTFKECELDTLTGTYFLYDIYGGNGCNVAPAILGIDWIEFPTLIGNPAVGDSCLFVVNPLASTEADIITITKIGTDTVPPTPVVYENLYEIGDNQGWHPAQAIEMTKKSENVFEGSFSFTADVTYFGFITVKPETDDWDLVNANRFGANNDGDEVAVGSNVIYKNANAFKVAAGNYTFTVDLTNMTLNIVKDESALNNVEGETNVQKIYENGHIYILRDGVIYTTTGAVVK